MGRGGGLEDFLPPLRIHEYSPPPPLVDGYLCFADQRFFKVHSGLDNSFSSDINNNQLFLLQYKEYDEVVLDHRAMKEKQRIKQEQEARENKAATKVCPL